MASPWKFLARLVSPRRQPKEENGPTEVKPDVSANARPSETVADEELNSTDRSVAAEPQSTGLEHSGDVTSGVRGTLDIESATVVGAVDPGPSVNADTAPHGTSDRLQSGEATTRKQSRRSKKGEAVGAAPRPTSAVATRSDDAISLDEEIRLLRDQLTIKLQLQNAQLKRMLERFER